MTSFIFAVLLLALAMFTVVVRKTYYSIPVRELKRRAEHHDVLAKNWYRAVAYGSSLRGLLWLFIVVTSAFGIILLTRSAPLWLSLIAVVLLIWATYSWLPASQVTTLGARLTNIATPPIVWLLEHLHPLLSRGVALAEKRYTAEAHTGIYEREDLVSVIEQQQRQVDSRVSQEQLEIVRRALHFDDRTVADIVQPRKKVVSVLASDTVSPVRIDELHKSGEDYIVVRDKKGGDIVGILEVHALGIQTSGSVADSMNPVVYYVHEQDSLSEALHAFFVTNHSVFVVVNSFEEYVGIITLENMIRELLGHVPGDDFDQYANLKAVAARHAKSTDEPTSVATADKPNLEVIE